MINKIPDIITQKLVSNETVLWWGKPDMRILSFDERYFVIRFLIVILMFGIPITYNNVEKDKGFLFLSIELLKHLLPIIFCFLIIFILFWIIKKINLWFIITDQRVVHFNSFTKKLIEKPLSDVYNIEVLKNGGNLYLGKYRYPVYSYSRIDYQKGYKEFFYERDKYFQKYDKFLLNYFHFFALKDVDTPAQIIREHCPNVKEYIDSKRKRKNNKSFNN